MIVFMNTLIILLAKYLYIVIVLAAIGITFYKTKADRRMEMIVIAIIAAAITLILIWVSKHLFYSPRPFVVGHFKPLIPHAADNGFPSDHTAISMGAAFVIYLFNKKAGIILATLALLVGISRVLAGIHHPIDIFGSVIIALVAVAAAHFIIKRYPKLLSCPMKKLGK